MRQIGQIKEDGQARVFGDYLIANKIRNEIERDDGAWTVWIREDEQLADAKARLERFVANPDASEFHGVVAEAKKIRAAEAEDMANYWQRVRSRRSLFARFSKHGIGLLTYSLITGCLVVAVFSWLGKDQQWVSRLVLADPTNLDRSFLPEVRAGEWWRLFTPMFLHFGVWHLFFNLSWLFQLGSMIEARLGAATLAALVIVTGVLPMIAQYIVGFYFGPGNVGGMSGVIYGLAGFVWMRGKYHRASGVGMDRQNWIYMLAWLVFCYTGLVGNIANTAHVAGLVIGVVWGRVSAWLALRRPE